MPSYHLKFHNCDGAVTDVAMAIEAADLAAIRTIAIEYAREIMAEEVRKGRLCLSCWIVISDASAGNVMTLHFGEAIAMVSEPACGHETEAQAWAS